MTRTLLIAGTASHVGKSTVAAGLCRLLADRGLDVAPFKAQNMSNNARVVVRPDADGDDRWGEIGVSQFVQARAARVTPTTDCNPVLLKPRGDGESQLVLQGRAVEHVPAGEYYGAHWDRARAAAVDAYERLAADVDVVVAEGAGSIAEINLHDRDLANVECARFADAEIVLLVDIERGGAFASLYGTIELLPEDLRERVAGAVITKFRGDASLLEPGIETIESKTGVPVLGVIPYDDPGLPEEDSVGLPARTERGVHGDDDVPDDRSVTVAVPRFPRVSNATDLEALAATPGVRVAYVPVPEAAEGEATGTGLEPASTRGGAETTSETDPFAAVGADAVVLPGTKNTVDDLLAFRAAGLDDALRAFDGPVVGICGGYQMLGERLTDAALEGTGEADVVEGVGLLPVETRFGADKRVERTTVPVDGSGPIAGASGTASGYEIHAGETTALEPVDRPLGPESARRGNVLGTYLHGLFDTDAVLTAFVETVAVRAGVDHPLLASDGSAVDGPGAEAAGHGAGTDSAYDRAARLVDDHVDLDPLSLPGA